MPRSRWNNTNGNQERLKQFDRFFNSPGCRSSCPGMADDLASDCGLCLKRCAALRVRLSSVAEAAPQSASWPSPLARSKRPSALSLEGGGTTDFRIQLFEKNYKNETSNVRLFMFRKHSAPGDNYLTLSVNWHSRDPG
jgi:hypothetical protein